MPQQCPRCTSRKIVSLPPAKKIRTLVGAVGRGGRSASATLSSTRPILGIALRMISDAILKGVDGPLDEQLNRHLLLVLRLRALLQTAALTVSVTPLYPPFDGAARCAALCADDTQRKHIWLIT